MDGEEDKMKDEYEAFESRNDVVVIILLRY